MLIASGLCRVLVGDVLLESVGFMYLSQAHRTRAFMLAVSEVSSSCTLQLILHGVANTACAFIAAWERSNCVFVGASTMANVVHSEAMTTWRN